MVTRHTEAAIKVCISTEKSCKCKTLGALFMFMDNAVEDFTLCKDYLQLLWELFGNCLERRLLRGVVMLLKEIFTLTFVERNHSILYSTFGFYIQVMICTLALQINV